MNVKIAISILCILFIRGHVAYSNSSLHEPEELKANLKSDAADTTRVRMLHEIGALYMQTDRDSAELYTRKGLALVEGMNFPSGKADLHQQMGLIYVGHNDFKLANQEFEKAEAEFQAANRPNGQARMLLNLGNIQHLWGDRPKALDFYVQGMAIVERINDVYLLPMFFINMGRVMEDMGDYDVASLYYNRADSAAVKNGRLDLIPNVKLMMSAVARYKGDNELAYSIAKEVLGLVDSIPYTRNHLHDAYRQLGAYCYEDGLYENSLIYYRQMFSALDSMEVGYLGPDSEPRMHALIGIGKAWAKLGNPANARINLEEAYEMATLASNPLQVKFASKELAALEEEEGNLASSIEYFKIYKLVSDSLQNEETIRNVARIEVRAEYEKERQQRRAEQDLINAQRKRKEVRYLSVSIIGALLSLVMVLLYRLQLVKVHETKLLTQNLQIDLNHKNRELASNVLYLLKKNELLLDISDRLKKSRRADKSNRMATIDKVIREIYTSSKDIGWEEFELRFKEVHSEFYNRLTTKFPNLTPNEMRLCAFLKLNMSTKDISAITFQTERSIVMARSRLKKKLGVQDERLHTFLSNM